MTAFAEAAALSPAGELCWTGAAPADWTQGRTTFGGLVAAAVIDAAAQAIGPERQIRSLDVAFVAPFAGPFEIGVEILDAGRSATQATVSVRSLDDGRLTSRSHVVAGLGRDSALVVRGRPAQQPPSGDPGEQGITMPYLDGVTPTFTQHVRYQWVSQAFPFTGAGPEASAVRGWCRHRTPVAGIPAVVSLLDAWPPTVMIMADKPVPGSTVRWSTQFTELGSQVGADDWLWFESDVVQSASGYATETQALYATTGELVAWGEQLLAVYDRRG